MISNFLNILTCSLWLRPDATIDIAFLLVTTGLVRFSFPAALCRADRGKHTLLFDLLSWAQLLLAFWVTTELFVASAVGGLSSLTEEEELFELLVTFPERLDKTDALLNLVPHFCSSAFSKGKEKLLLETILSSFQSWGKAVALPWSLNAAVTSSPYLCITSPLPPSLLLPDL